MAKAKRKRLQKQILCLKAELSQLKEKPCEPTDVGLLQSSLANYRKTLVDILKENDSYKRENERLNRLVAKLNEVLVAKTDSKGYRSA